MLARSALPRADATGGEHQAALERLAADLRADVALFGADRVPLASVGKPLPAPGESRESGGGGEARGGPPGGGGGAAPRPGRAEAAPPRGGVPAPPAFPYMRLSP